MGSVTMRKGGKQQKEREHAFDVLANRSIIRFPGSRRFRAAWRCDPPKAIDRNDE
jgi:hypothetical protein